MVTWSALIIHIRPCSDKSWLYINEPLWGINAIAMIPKVLLHSYVEPFDHCQDTKPLNHHPHELNIHLSHVPQNNKQHTFCCCCSCWAFSTSLVLAAIAADFASVAFLRSSASFCCCCSRSAFSDLIVLFKILPPAALSCSGVTWSCNEKSIHL